MCYSLWYNAHTMLPATGRQHRRCIIPQTVTHSLVLLKMGKIISRTFVELTGIINKLLLLHLVGCLYYLYQWCTVKQKFMSCNFCVILKWCNVQVFLLQSHSLQQLYHKESLHLPAHPIRATMLWEMIKKRHSVLVSEFGGCQGMALGNTLLTKLWTPCNV